MWAKTPFWSFVLANLTKIQHIMIINMLKSWCFLFQIDECQERPPMSRDIGGLFVNQLLKSRVRSTSLNLQKLSQLLCRLSKRFIAVLAGRSLWANKDSGTMGLQRQNCGRVLSARTVSVAVAGDNRPCAMWVLWHNCCWSYSQYAGNGTRWCCAVIRSNCWCRRPPGRYTTTPW